MVYGTDLPGKRAKARLPFEHHLIHHQLQGYCWFLFSSFGQARFHFNIHSLLKVFSFLILRRRQSYKDSALRKVPNRLLPFFCWNLPFFDFFDSLYHPSISLVLHLGVSFHFDSVRCVSAWGDTRVIVFGSQRADLISWYSPKIPRRKKIQRTVDFGNKPRRIASLFCARVTTRFWTRCERTLRNSLSHRT